MSLPLVRIIILLSIGNNNSLVSYCGPNAPPVARIAKPRESNYSVIFRDKHHKKNRFFMGTFVGALLDRFFNKNNNKQ